jgi:hypothetical protein
MIADTRLHECSEMFLISMEFADRPAYKRYNEHADHPRFVEERWLSEVSEFLETRPRGAVGIAVGAVGTRQIGSVRLSMSLG